MKILIIGTGPISFAFIRKLTKKNKNYNIYISDSSSSKKDTQDLFGVNSIYYNYGVGGLGNYWHGVQDVELVKNYGAIDKESLFSHFNAFKFDGNYEFIPYFVPRYNCQYKILPPVISIDNIDSSGVTISHEGSKKKYDFVFVGIGCGGKKDPLIQSNIATRSNTISDHIIFNSTKLIKSQNENLKHSLKGHFRKYSVLKVNDLILKKSVRNVISKKSISAKNKSIYLQDKKKILLSHFRRFNIGQIISSLNLRYGTPSFSSLGFYFYQMKAKDIYRVDKNFQLSLNKEVFDKIKNTLIESKIDLDFNSFVSAIHLHAGYKSIENSSLIGVNSFNSGNVLTVVTPNININITEKHFTALLMRIAENVADEICKY